MKIQFLSVCSWRPDYEHEDTVSLLVNDSILIDTGWFCVRNLLRVGKTPEDVKLLMFTHMHQDHYMSLPAFIFYLLNNRHDASGVTIRGPERLEEVMDLSLALAGKHIHYVNEPGPNYSRLEPGEGIELEDLRIETCPSRHAAPGICFKFIDKKTGGVCVYTGDTAPSEIIDEFAKGCDVLIHEQSWGPTRPEGNVNRSAHSSAQDAARCAKKAGAKKLYLVHTPANNKEPSLAAAREIFAESYRPSDMDVIEL